MKFLQVLLLSFFTTALLAQSANDIEGTWLTEEKTAYIKIYEKDNKFFGKVTWLEEPYDEDGNPKTDPDGKPVLHMEIMKNFIFEDDEWVDGTIYDAKSGKTYHGSIEMDGSDKLDLRGSVDSFGLIGRTETWTRVEGK
jgi:uncharacterized protein (DUF2147 family)